ncbi:hypothetical protein RRG08_047837 [Elysia crispata]|uniref:Uncharacterized protein n=1 Tax=Elysia crispata TaxID=231223 RepID=A0AAE0ZXQ6_9GAST|nr:hypothetical protein RRG08_047837 [Elysia crispata]
MPCCITSYRNKQVVRGTQQDHKLVKSSNRPQFISATDLPRCHLRNGKRRDSKGIVEDEEPDTYRANLVIPRRF